MAGTQSVSDQWIVLKGKAPVSGLCRIYRRQTSRIMVKCERLPADATRLHVVAGYQGRPSNVGVLVHGQLERALDIPDGRVDLILIVRVPDGGVPEILLTGGSGQPIRMETLHTLLRVRQPDNEPTRPVPGGQAAAPYGDSPGSKAQSASAPVSEPVWPSRPVDIAIPVPEQAASALTVVAQEAALTEPEPALAVSESDPEPAVAEVTVSDPEPVAAEVMVSDPEPAAAEVMAPGLDPQPELAVTADEPSEAVETVAQAQAEAQPVFAPGNPIPWPDVPSAVTFAQEEEAVPMAEGARHPEREQATRQRNMPEPPKPQAEWTELMRRVEDGFLQMLHEHTPVTPFVRTYPHSSWVRVESPAAPRGHYITGILYNDGMPQAFCWGIPGAHAANPPPGLPDHIFQETETADAAPEEGYWLFFQKLEDLAE